MPLSTESTTCPLSDREREILGLIAAGDSAKMVARRLGISEFTVRWHLLHCRDRFGAENTMHLLSLTWRYIERDNA